MRYAEQPDMRYIDIREFREQGYLQELNRQFLHPLGLALTITFDRDGNERLGAVWDCRDDPEGVYFVGDIGRGVRGAKVERIARITEERRPAREAALGYFVQPVPS